MNLLICLFDIVSFLRKLSVCEFVKVYSLRPIFYAGIERSLNIRLTPLLGIRSFCGL